MEIESFHVRTIKTFAAELQVVEMTTHRLQAINLWRLRTEQKKIHRAVKTFSKCPAAK